MGKFEHVLGRIRIHKGIIDFLSDNSGAHRDHSIGHLFGNRHNVRSNTKRISAGLCTQASEPADDFIKNQQNVVLGANFPQPVQVPNGRRNDPGRARHWLYNHRGNV